MKYERICQGCNKTFFKRPKDTIKKWYNARKHCSVACYKKCYIPEMHSKFKHGKRNSRLFSVWDNMIRRCSDPSHPCFKNYGGRGINVCNEWLQFKPFYEWAKPFEHTKGISLDRIDNNNGYSSDNCRFVSMKENTNNKRNSININAFGEIKTLYHWSIDPRCKTTRHGLRWRIKQKWPAEQAIISPKFSRPKCVKI